MKILLGKTLSLLRHRAQLNQQEIADALYISRATYSKWETDAIEMPHSKLFMIPRIYKVSIFDLLDLIKDSNGIGKTQGQQLSADMNHDLVSIKQHIAVIQTIVAGRK